MTTPPTTPAPEREFSETCWILTLFGTAVGAGVLYLPLQIGTADLWAFTTLALFVFPVIYLSHRTVIAMLLEGRPEHDYTEVVILYFGRLIGMATAAVFFLTFYAVLYTYTVGLNANLGDFLYTAGWTRTDLGEGPWLSLPILTVFALLHTFGQTLVLRLMTAISAALIVILAGISLYLIPHWDPSAFYSVPASLEYSTDLLLIFPILVFSFVFFPPLSAMVTDYRCISDAPPGLHRRQLNRIAMKATLLLICFVILFVFSSILTLSPEEFEQGAEHNWNCLTLLSHQDNLPRGIAQFGVAVGLLALITSFIGVFFAVRTTAHRLLTVVLAPFLAKEGGAAQRDAKFDHGILIGVFASLWVLTWLNPSVMDLFGLIVAPLVAVFLFILPVAVLARARGIRAALRPSLLFVLGAGLLLLVSYRLGTLLKELL